MIICNIGRQREAMQAFAGGRDIVCREAAMAATRDQTARAIRPDAETAEGGAAPNSPGHSPTPGEQLRQHVADETRRLPSEPPGAPPAGRPAGPPAGAPATDAPKSGKRKFIA